MYWDMLTMGDEDFKKLQKVVDKMLEEGKEYRRKKQRIEELRKQQEVTKGMEWYRLEEEIQELLDEE